MKRGIAQYPGLALVKQDIWSYYKLLQINPVFLDDHLVIIAQVPLVDKTC